MAAKVTGKVSANSIEEVVTAMNVRLAANATEVAIGNPVFDSGSGKWHWTYTTT